MKDEILDFWDSIPIRWRALKKNPSKMVTNIIIVVELFCLVLMVFNPTSNFVLGFTAIVFIIGLAKYIWDVR